MLSRRAPSIPACSADARSHARSASLPTAVAVARIDDVHEGVERARAHVGADEVGQLMLRQGTARGEHGVAGHDQGQGVGSCLVPDPSGLRDVFEQGTDRRRLQAFHGNTVHLEPVERVLEFLELLVWADAADADHHAGWPPDDGEAAHGGSSEGGTRRGRDIVNRRFTIRSSSPCRQAPSMELARCADMRWSVGLAGTPYALTARTKPLKNFSSTAAASWSASMPLAFKNSRASATR